MNAEITGEHRQGSVNCRTPIGDASANWPERTSELSHPPSSEATLGRRDRDETYVTPWSEKIRSRSGPTRTDLLELSRLAVMDSVPNWSR